MKIKKIYNKWIPHVDNKLNGKCELYVVFDDDSELIAKDYRVKDLEPKKDAILK
jgi:hypothetical protein